MGLVADGRGSAPQRHLFDLANKLYDNFTVVYELFIPELGQRFDIFIMEMGIALEYDGEQHYEFNEHFHKDTNGYIASKKLDKEKEEFCSRNGIKLVRFRGDISDYDKNKLNVAIQRCHYPEGDFCLDIFDKRSSRLDDEREYRRKRYIKSKDLAGNS